MSASANANEALAPTVPIPVAIYTRVSSDQQVGGRFDSCQHQVEVCREFIKRQAPLGWHEVVCYTDLAFSGGTMNRPGIRALIAAIDAGLVKVVLTYKLERILRSTYDWGQFSRFLEEHGCRLVSPNDDLTDTSASGRLKANILVSFAEYERLNVAEKIRSKMLAMAKRGMWAGGFVPFGYDYDRELQLLKPSAIEAPVVRRIFRQAAALAPLGKIAARLNEEGIRTGQRLVRNAAGERRVVGQKPFRTDVLRRCIRNPLYRGAVKFEGEEFKGQHPPLVSPELWDQANAALAQAGKDRRPQLRRRDKYANPLKGVAHCAKCRSPLFSRASGKEVRGRAPYRYYTCASPEARVGHCSLGSVSAEVLETSIVGFLTKMATSEPTLEMLRDTLPGIEATRSRLRTRLGDVAAAAATLQRQISNCVDAIAAEGAVAIKPELAQRICDLREKRQPLLVQRGQLQQELRAIERSGADYAQVRDVAERLGRILPGLDRTQQGILVRDILERVEVGVAAERPRGKQYPRTLSLGMRLRLDRLIAATEGGGLVGEETAPAVGSTGKIAEFAIEVAVRSRREVEIVAPFHAQVGETQSEYPAAAVLQSQHEHPIHRASSWQIDAARVSVRLIAAREKVSPSLVSLYLKLLRLAPEIQDYLRGLATRQAARFFSLRRMAPLAQFDRDRQLAEFAALKAHFSARS